MGVYLDAAESVFYGHERHSCVAIDFAVDPRLIFTSPERDVYESLFCPPGVFVSAWGVGWGGDAHQCRVLALCLMSAIAGEKA